MLETKTVVTAYPFVLTIFTSRKEGVTPQQFQEHQETIYVPLLQETAGKLHPLAWSRRYHIGDDECPTGVPRQLIGTQEGLTWDCVGEMTFADELHFQQFVAWMHSEGAEAILEEEENFCDTALTKVIVMRRGVTLGERAEVQKLDA